ncbi:MAG: GSCFA domain-containing protein [Candidatus Cloacimonetes bacterium]|nr:GSCFA domain-containing protein [Candidatus Cloacimonadota bacterium]
MARHYQRRADEGFRSRIAIPPPPFQFSWTDPLLACGSCFAQDVCGSLQSAGLPVTRNPLGTVYHPLPLAAQLARWQQGKPFQREDLVDCDRGWASLEAHGHFAGREQDAVLQSLNAAVEEGHRAWHEARALVLALGSAWAWLDRSSGLATANCHRLPGSRFERRLVSVDELVAGLGQALEEFLTASPQRLVLLTVSPVRHLRDDAHENTLSKSALHLAVAELCRGHERIHYFPAWELMMDELRDYRYYGDDLAHPSPMAIEYISHRFAEVWLSPETRAMMDELNAVRTALEHRPSEPGSVVYARFLLHQRERLDQISRTWPGVHLHAFHQRLQTLEQLHFPEILAPDHPEADPS